MRKEESNRRLFPGRAIYKYLAVSLLALLIYWPQASEATSPDRLVRDGLRYGFHSAYSSVLKSKAFLSYKGTIKRITDERFISNATYSLVPREPGKSGVRFYEAIKISSHDGVNLSANLMVPEREAEELRPTIVFVSTWALDKNEYLQRAISFAEDGYVVLSYTPRGFGFSDGVADVAGRKDTADASAVIDWLQRNAAIDPEGIAFSGISYGATIGLLAAAFDPRIKVVVGLSAGTSLDEALYSQETPHTSWSLLLLGSGLAFGRIDDDASRHFRNLLAHRRIGQALSWARLRSPLRYLSRLNANNTKILLIHNWHDYLFSPDGAFRFVDGLTTPRKLLMTSGIHVIPEVLGVTEINEPAWKTVDAWLDRYIRQKATGSGDDYPIEIDVRNNQDSSMEQWRRWHSDSLDRRHYYLEAGGQLTTTRHASTVDYTVDYRRLRSRVDLFTNTGFPTLRSVIETYAGWRLPHLPLFESAHAVVHLTEPLVDPLRARGQSNLSIRVTPQSSRFHMVGYLYDLTPGGTASLITHGAVTVWDAQAGVERPVDLKMRSTAYDVAAGHKLALVIDTFDPLYLCPVKEAFRLDIHYRPDVPFVLTIPHLVSED